MTETLNCRINTEFMKFKHCPIKFAEKEISTDLKFKRDKLISKLELVSREEFEVLKKLVEKQDQKIKKLMTKTKRAKKS